ncbi:AAA family ATPase [Corynebacterium variabile]|uniref:AAA family ATPase n=1 Tax=Corynebacterium variabile TaxID=1727 RepID=UPI00289D7AF1|nr:AAA family ATPase [Corynebacterium variabile]
MTGSLRSQILSLSQLAELPGMEPLIDRTIDRGTVNLLAAAPASGKSFLALDWCACLATGKPWQGRAVHFPVTEDEEHQWDYEGQGYRILYVAGEGAYGLSQRLNAWKAAWGHDIPDHRLEILPAAANLMNDADVAELCSIVQEDHVGLLVIDTLSRSIAGADENSAQDMSKAVKALDHIRASMPGLGTVLVVHHLGKGGQVRGSSALEGAVDTAYRMEKEGDLIELSCTKRKDGPDDDRMNLELHTIDSSCVLQSCGDEAGAVGNRLVDLYLECFSEQGSVTKTDLKSVWSGSDSSFFKALNQAVKAGHIVQSNEKTPRYSLGTEVSINALNQTR